MKMTSEIWPPSSIYVSNMTVAITRKEKKTESCKNYVVCDSVTKTGVCKLFFRCQIALALCHQRYELYNKRHNMRVKHCYNARTYKRILLDKNVEYSLVDGLIRICIK